MDNDTLTTIQAAKLCRTTSMSIIRWIESGKINAYTTPGGHRRIIREDLIDFMKKNNIPILDKNMIPRKRILIVDDEELIREEVANYLQLPGFNYDVATAEDGFKAGIMVSEFDPDIILLDLMMPDIDGFKVCEEIKKNPHKKNVKIFILTGYGSEENVQRAYECGADKVLIKPIGNDELVREIEAII